MEGNIPPEVRAGSRTGVDGAGADRHVPLVLLERVRSARVVRYWGLARVNQLSSDRAPRRMATQQVTVRHCSLVSRAAAPRPARNEYSFHALLKNQAYREAFTLVRTGAPPGT